MASVVGICGLRAIVRLLSERSIEGGGSGRLNGNRCCEGRGGICGKAGGDESEGGGVAGEDGPGLEEKGGLMFDGCNKLFAVNCVSFIR